jgi:hypothetical protein
MALCDGCFDDFVHPLWLELETDNRSIPTFGRRNFPLSKLN